MAIFEGAGVALVTPFTESGEVNYEKLEALLEEQIAGGTDAIIACGTTGESATMSYEEHLDVIRFTCKVVNKRIPVIAGTGSNCTREAIHLSKEAEKAGADGLLLVTPYYNKANEKGLVAHFNFIAEHAGIPIILYNVPSRTGVNISPEVYRQLCENPLIRAAKEASGSIAGIARTKSLCGDELDIYAGNDDYIVPVMSLGGRGVISVLGNLLPEAVCKMCSLCTKGDFSSAAKLQMKLMPLIDALFCDVNPIPIKEALSLSGFDAGPLRLPLYPLSEEKREKLCSVLKDFDIV